MGELRTHARFGCLRDLKDGRDEDFMFHLVRKPTIIPVKSNNRALNAPTYDQGNEGSCTGFGFNDTVERWVLRNHRAHFVHLSAAYTYYNGRLLEGTTESDSGAMPRDIVKAATRYGVVPDKEFPYVVGKYAVAPAPHDIEAGKIHILKAYHRVRNAEEIRQAIAQGWDVFGGWTLYGNFMRIGPNGILDWPTYTDSVAGGHCMSIEDYDDSWQLPQSAKGVFTLTNSWGPTWGDSGRVHMSYDYCEKFGMDFWATEFIEGFDATMLTRRN